MLIIFWCILILSNPICSINRFVSEDPVHRRLEFLERVHRNQIVFCCRSLHSCDTSEVDDQKEKERIEAVTAFTHCGVLYIVCLGDHFGEEVFQLDVSKLQSVPDEDELRSVFVCVCVCLCQCLCAYVSVCLSV